MNRRIWTGLIVLLSLVAGSSSLMAQSGDLKGHLYVMSQLLGPGTRVGVICSMASHAQDLQGILVGSKAYKLDVSFFDAKSAMDLEKGVTALFSSKKIQAVFILPNSVASSKTAVQILAQKCRANRIILVGSDAGAVAAGAPVALIRGEGGVKIHLNKAEAAKMGLEVPASLQAKVE